MTLLLFVVVVDQPKEGRIQKRESERERERIGDENLERWKISLYRLCIYLFLNVESMCIIYIYIYIERERERERKREIEKEKMINMKNKQN